MLNISLQLDNQASDSTKTPGSKTHTNSSLHSSTTHRAQGHLKENSIINQTLSNLYKPRRRWPEQVSRIDMQPNQIIKLSQYQY